MRANHWTYGFWRNIRIAEEHEKEIIAYQYQFGPPQLDMARIIDDSFDLAKFFSQLKDNEPFQHKATITLADGEKFWLLSSPTEDT